MQEVIEDNDQAKVSDLFGYFNNQLTITCNYETLFDFHDRQLAEGVIDP